MVVILIVLVVVVVVVVVIVVVDFLTFKAAVSSSSCFVALDVGCLYRVTLGGMAIPLVIVK